MTFSLSQSPHIHNASSTRRVMGDVLIALVPSVIAAGILFPARGLLLLLTALLSSVSGELLYNLLTKGKNTLPDLSACVTGVILGLNLPYTVPLWQVAIGGIIATAFVKMLFGGLGRNFANPAATARIVLLVSFSEVSRSTVTRFQTVVDGVSTPTPLPLLFGGASGDVPSLLDLFLGNHGGALGETCILAILLGGGYLLCRRVITWHTPVAFIGSVFLFTLLFTGSPYLAFAGVLSGGVCFAAFFMATDYATTPLTASGKLIFGIGCGCITVLIRLFASLPGGVSYSLLLMNLLVPFIDRLTVKMPLGGIRHEK